MSNEITIQGVECESMSDALQWADASGQGEAVVIEGHGPMVVPQSDLDRLAEAGVGFAYLFNHEMPDGTFRIITVPVN
jgi:hypothetical protein